MKNPLFEFLNNLKGKVIEITQKGDFTISDLDRPLNRENDCFLQPKMLTRVVDCNLENFKNEILIKTNIKEFETYNLSFESNEYFDIKTGKFNLSARNARCYTKSGVIWIVINVFDENFPFEISLEHNY